MKYFEGTIEYERKINDIEDSEELKSRTLLISLYVKNYFLKVEIKNKHLDLEYEFIYDPVKEVYYEIMHSEKLVCKRALKAKSTQSFINYPLRKIESGMFCIGNKKYVSDGNSHSLYEIYITSSIDLNIKYNASYLCLLKTPSKELKSFIISSSKRSYKSKYSESHIETNLLNIKPQTLNHNIFKLDKSKTKKYRYLSEEQYRKEQDLKSDGFFESDALKILPIELNRELNSEEKTYPLKSLSLLFEKNPKLKIKYENERKEKSRRHNENMNKFTTQLLEKELGRELSEEEKKNPVSLFLEEIKKSSEKNIRLGAELIRLLNAEQ